MEGLIKRIQNLSTLEKQSPFKTFAKIKTKKIPDIIGKSTSGNFFKVKCEDDEDIGFWIPRQSQLQILCCAFLFADAVKDADFAIQKPSSNQCNIHFLTPLKIESNLVAKKTYKFIHNKAFLRRHFKDQLAQNPSLYETYNEEIFGKDAYISDTFLSVCKTLDKLLFIAGSEELRSCENAIYSVSRLSLLNKRDGNNTSKLLSISTENNPRRQIPKYAYYRPVFDISSKYHQLYYETRPEDYDFAMHIMVYIEFLNNSPSAITFTYFTPNVQKMIKYFWEILKDSVNRKCDEKIGIKVLQNVMLDFTELCATIHFKLTDFLYYSVLICQLGIIAINRNYKEAPLQVIVLLRYRIYNVLKDYPSTLFDYVVEKYADHVVSTLHL